MRFLGLAFANAVVAQSGLAQRPGGLISAYPVVETPTDMQAWKVRYLTTTGKSKPIQGTGMVVAPREALPREPQ